LRGWKPLAEKVSNIYNDLKKQGHVFIFSDRYQISSELAFYVDGHPETFCINLGRRMNQFDLWPDMNATAEKLRSESNGPVVINGILVMFGNSDLPDAVSNAFDKCDKKAFAVREGNYILRKYTIFVCYDFKRIDTVMPDRY
jgi:undecaprenyl-diphosphatase